MLKGKSHTQAVSSHRAWPHRSSGPTYSLGPLVLGGQPPQHRADTTVSLSYALLSVVKSGAGAVWGCPGLVLTHPVSGREDGQAGWGLGLLTQWHQQRSQVPTRQLCAGSSAPTGHQTD